MKNVRLFKSESEKEQAIHVSEITVSGATLPFSDGSEMMGFFRWRVGMTYPSALTLTRDPEEGDECWIYWNEDDAGTATTVSGVKSEYIEPLIGYTKKKTIVLSDLGPANKNPFSYYGEFNVEFENPIVVPVN